MKKYPIDLSMLTSDEIAQFDENMVVLVKGDSNVALYMRFSSDRQTEQSIEGQLRDAISFCKLRKYRIRAIYVDRAISARADAEKRVNFMQMISDSDKRKWEYVIVWKLDRFARNRNDSAIYKMRLRKNGVKVVSVAENISDNPEGIILESVLEGMAEFYSAELSQKITRGLRESALKCRSIGGHVPLGYKIENHKLVIEPVGAAIVQKAFELYSQGWTVADICREFNTRGYRTAKNAEFNRNSFKSMFKNKRYIGVYTYKDVQIEGGVPAIIDKDLFEEVGRRLKKNEEAPARGKAKVDYLLSGKLFCGHCGAPMNGESGTSKTGEVHHYYACYTRKRRGNCRKKSMRKSLVEKWVAEDAYALLTQEVIEEIADIAVSQTEADIAQHTKLPELTAKRAELEQGIDNIATAIEKGVASERLMSRLTELEKEKKILDRQIADEEKDVFRLDRDQVIFWLSQFSEGDINDERFRRQLIDLMVNSVTVWDLPDGDFEITTAYNLTSCKSSTFKASERFGFEKPSSTIERISELIVFGTLCVQTKRHSLP